jgi:isopenicillin N synthase-like dioxygenase
MTKNDEFFLQLIAIFQASALQGMGKMKNPVTEKTEINIEQATHAINMLDMLREKTNNNLTDSLHRTLNQVISDLKLNFTDIKQ